MEEETAHTRRHREIPRAMLNMQRTKVEEITVPVGSGAFIFWFSVWTYLPILTCCLAPLTNILSIASLITRWRSDSQGDLVADVMEVYALNGVSLALGTVGNVTLLLNFGQRLPFRIAQTATVVLLLMASSFLAAALFVGRQQYPPGYQRTEGFWFGVIACILYLLCSLTCAMNMLGSALKKYPAEFNLDRSERALIVYTFIFGVWLVWGAGMFSVLMDLSYGNAMYYCVTSVLTIGYGDERPLNVAAKVLALIYSLSGLIILGLIIAMIRQTVSKAAAPIIFWNRVEMGRKKLLNKLHREKITITQQESFDLMRSIRHSAKRYGNNVSALWSLVVFILFWLIGALVFYYTEQWDYFTSVYFAMLSLLTIGYGDYTPTSPAGRAFFIVWAILAIPMMTALISNVGDTLYNWAMLATSSRLVRSLFNRTKQQEEVEEEEEANDSGNDNDEERSINEVLRDARQRHETATKSINLLETTKALLRESKCTPHKRYTFAEWKALSKELELPDSEIRSLGLDRPDYWISDDSPLRYPINEPDYMLYILFNKIQADMENRLKSIEEEISTLYLYDKKVD